MGKIWRFSRQKWIEDGHRHSESVKRTGNVINVYKLRLLYLSKTPNAEHDRRCVFRRYQATIFH